MIEAAFDLSSTCAHLGLGATVVPLPGFAWDEDSLTRYEAEHAADGDEGRLVFLGPVTETWTSWERHPAGDELVILLSGRVTIIQETEDGAERRISAGAGEALINPKGAWHTADVHEPGQALYVTAGRGTEHRPR